MLILINLILMKVNYITLFNKKILIWNKLKLSYKSKIILVLNYNKNC